MRDYSSYKFLKVEKTGKVATVWLNRPESLNAIHGDLHKELECIWRDLEEDADVNAIVLTGAGRAFCAGGDVKWMAQFMGGERKGADLLAATGRARRLVEGILDVEQPVIAAVNGDAMGLGATLALFCDVIVASEQARIADPHVRVGVVAGDGGAVIWPLLIGPARAKEFLMRGHGVTGAEAARIGLVNHAVPPDQVLAKAREIAAEIAEGATLAIRWTKRSVNRWLKQQVNMILDTSVAFEMLTFETNDHIEAVQAFIEKRKPNYTGR
ncbi:MAG: enoyl-CoA hydratase/isomerase family protein [Nitrospirae bacterium]|nr:enoyl-CoA hydratase/isomerase family protein [Nitrospirota bacterium]